MQHEKFYMQLLSHMKSTFSENETLRKSIFKSKWNFDRFNINKSVQILTAAIIKNNGF